MAGDHALQDDGQLPGGEGHVHVQLGQVATRPGRVGLGDGGAAGEAGHDRRGRAQGEGLVAGLGPVHQQQADVGQRVAEGAQLPVEHGQDLAGGGEDDVVEAEVAVDDPGRADLGGEVGRQAAVDLVEGGQGAGPGLVELALPAGQLAFQVAVVAAELAEADLVGVDPVEGDQGVHQRVGRPGPRRLVQAGGHGGLVAGDDAVDVGHHVEGGAGDGRVLAEAEGGRHRHRGAGQGGDDPVLAAHVVGRGQHPVQGRAAQHPARPGRVGDPVGEVGTAPGDLADGQRRPHPGRRWPGTRPVTPAGSIPGVTPDPLPGLHRPGRGGVADGLGHRRGHPAVEHAGDDVVGAQLVVVHPAGDRPGRGDLHLLGDGVGPGVQRPPEHAREGEHVVDLVGLVAAAGGDHGGVAAGAGRVDLGVGVGQGEHDRVGGHGGDVVRVEDAGAADPDEHVGAGQHLAQRAGPARRGWCARPPSACSRPGPRGPGGWPRRGRRPRSGSPPRPGGS